MTQKLKTIGHNNSINVWMIIGMNGYTYATYLVKKAKKKMVHVCIYF